MAQKAGRHHQKRKFKKLLAKVFLEGGDGAKDFFSNIPHEMWTQAFDKGCRYGNMTTNLCECFNAVLKGVRSLPITALVQMTFYRVAEYFNSRRENARQALELSQPHTPRVALELGRRQDKSTRHQVLSFNRSEGLFHVQTATTGTGKGNNVQVVQLKEGTCTCGKWQNMHLPCSHVLAACNHAAVDFMQYVDPVYTIQSYYASYAPTFFPVEHEEYWTPSSMPTLHPNKALVREKGRPRCTRLRNEMDWKESKRTVRCGVCREEGHNRTRCPHRNEGGDAVGPSD